VLAYLVRRCVYGFFTILGVLALLFVLFFLYAQPLDMARRAVGEKAPQEVLEKWITAHGYDRPKSEQFVDHFRSMLTFDFGRSDLDDSSIADRIRRGAGPSLTLTLPLFVSGVAISVALSLFVAYFRETYIDRSGVALCVLGMSVSILIYIIGGQYLLAKVLRLVPISGFESGLDALKFIVLPVVIGVVSGIGSGSRWYRTFFLEEAGKDYVRTARAKGLAESLVMFRHILRNALIPIVTGVVAVLPLLFMGSLLLESFFAIPGLGSYTIDAINNQDFAIVRAMVFLGSVLYIIGLILVDITYTLVDPRVRLA